MDHRTAAFRYSLAPVLKRDAWERDTLGGELQRARLLAEQSQRVYDAALAQVSAAEARMRELHRPEQAIELAGLRLLHVYLEQAHLAAAMRRSELRKAMGLLEQVQTQFESKRLAVRTLEKHRERLHLEHQQDQGRRQQHAADDAWLMRSAPR